MHEIEFQKRHLSDFMKLIDSDMGRALVQALMAKRPNIVPLPQEHLMIDQGGAVRGYEQCVKNILSLAVPKEIKSTVLQNYNVKPNQPEEPAGS